MKTPAFELLLTRMSPTQQSALEELELTHNDLVWDGGTVDTRPLRVSIKNVKGQNMAAINTREKEAFLRLEFRGRDYNGPNAVPTNHRNFDKMCDLINSSSVKVASDIMEAIKQKYL